MLVRFPEGEFMLGDEQLRKFSVIPKLAGDEKCVEFTKYYAEFKLMLEGEFRTDFSKLDEVEEHHMIMCYFGLDLHDFYLEVYIHEAIQIKTKVFRFFKKYFKLLNWNMEHLCANPNIPWSFWKCRKSMIDWKGLSCNRNIPLEVFEKYRCVLHRHSLYKTQNIPRKVWEKHIGDGDFNDWRYICRYVNIPLDVLNENIGRIEWKWMSCNPYVPWEFFERNIDEVNWFSLCECAKIPVEVLNKNLDKIYWAGISSNPNIPIEFFDEHADKLVWECLTLNPSIPLWFFKKHLDKVDWIRIGRHPNMTVEFYETHADKIGVEGLIGNSHLPWSFFEIRLDVVLRDHFTAFCGNSSVPCDMFDEELQKILKGDEKLKRSRSDGMKVLAKNDFSMYKYNHLKFMKKYTFDREWKRFIDKDEL